MIDSLLNAPILYHLDKLVQSVLLGKVVHLVGLYQLYANHHVPTKPSKVLLSLIKIFNNLSSIVHHNNTQRLKIVLLDQYRCMMHHHNLWLPNPSALFRCKLALTFPQDLGTVVVNSVINYQRTQTNLKACVLNRIHINHTCINNLKCSLKCNLICNFNRLNSNNKGCHLLRCLLKYLLLVHTIKTNTILREAILFNNSRGQLEKNSCTIL
mmetsp:Transcript_6679/g.7271  ORF Transcript_6679/g.7271 Transcript_6679/m.7271 type:complete len:211 (+) Transcript_6679:1213-1845(+)